MFAAVALSIGLHFALSALVFIVPLSATQFNDVLTTGSLLRVTTSAGALVLVHNVYGQAAPESRLRIRGPMLGLTLMWGYDLNLATLAYLQGSASRASTSCSSCAGRSWLSTAPLVRCDRGHQELAQGQAVARGNVPVALAARHLHLSRDHGRARYGLPPQPMGLGDGEHDGPAHRDDYRRRRSGAFVSGRAAGSRSSSPSICSSIATIIAPNGFALPIRSAGAAPTPRRSAIGSSSPLPISSTRPAACCWSATPAGRSASRRRGIGPAAIPPPGESRTRRDFWTAIEKSGRILEFEALAPRLGRAADKTLPVPALDARRRARCGPGFR